MTLTGSIYSFYPLFPPALGTTLDLSLSPGSLDLPSNVDIMVLPSDLNPFVKVLSESSTKLASHKRACPNTCDVQKGLSPQMKENRTGDSILEGWSGQTRLSVNPGRLAKGINGGTFVEILILPLAEENDLVTVPARTKVAILRI